MKIGFIKFGLKTYFKDSKDNQGYNHELVSIFDIFKNKGHECYMISVSDIDYDINKEVDIYFAFNGPWRYSGTSENNPVMLKNYAIPYQDLLNKTSKPWVYFQTDPRKAYNVMLNNHITNKPKYILTQEKENYSHLDKIILYKKNIPELKDKSIDIGIIMNEKDKKRCNELLTFLGWYSKFNSGIIDIKGKWKTENKYLSGQLNHSEIPNYLQNVKYSLNIGSDLYWTNQKIYELALNGVISFNYKIDKDCLSIPKDDYSRVKDECDFEDKINKLNKDKELYNKILKEQQGLLLKDEYFDGSLLYNTIMSKISV